MIAALTRFCLVHRFLLFVSYNRSPTVHSAARSSNSSFSVALILTAFIRLRPEFPAGFGSLPQRNRRAFRECMPDGIAQILSF